MKHSLRHTKSGLIKDRRQFLQCFAGGSLAFSTVPFIGKLRIEEASSNEVFGIQHNEPADESFWRLVREQFVIHPERIMLNAANLCPSPHMVREAVTRFTDDLDGDVSFQNRSKYSALREQSREKVAAFVGASADEIALVRNTSEANNIIASGLELTEGDEVLLFDQNHPTNNISWEVSAARIGFKVLRFGLNSPPQSAEEIFSTLQGAISDKTKVLAFSELSNTTGVRLPSKEICTFARQRGIYTHIDGAQTFGALVINLHEKGCDSYAASSHKWLMGPKETGILYVREDCIDKVWASDVGVGWGNDVETSAKGARKFETLGQRDDAALSAIGTTIDFLNLLGSDRIELRVHELASILKQGVSKIPGAQLKTSVDTSLSGGVCVMEFEGKDNGKIYEQLYKEYGIAGAPTGGVRLCPHIYNTMDEIERTIEALAKLVRET